MSTFPRGAYGLRLGPPLEDAYLVDVPSDWPKWELQWRQTPAEPRQARRIGPDEVLLNVLPKGQVLIERATRRSTLLLPSAPRPEARARPHLSSTAVVVAWWLGRRSFHAGAFIADGAAWGVLGERGDGKSSNGLIFDPERRPHRKRQAPPVPPGAAHSQRRDQRSPDL